MVPVSLTSLTNLKYQLQQKSCFPSRKVPASFESLWEFGSISGEEVVFVLHKFFNRMEVIGKPVIRPLCRIVWACTVTQSELNLAPLSPMYRYPSRTRHPPPSSFSQLSHAEPIPVLEIGSFYGTNSLCLALYYRIFPLRTFFYRIRIRTDFGRLDPDPGRQNDSQRQNKFEVLDVLCCELKASPY